MIRIIIVDQWSKDSSDPVFWALRQVNIYDREIYMLKRELRGKMISPQDFESIVVHMKIQIAKLEDLISIGMSGRIIDNRETHPP